MKELVCKYLVLAHIIWLKFLVNVDKYSVHAADVYDFPSPKATVSQ